MAQQQMLDTGFNDEYANPGELEYKLAGYNGWSDIPDAERSKMKSLFYAKLKFIRDTEGEAAARAWDKANRPKKRKPTFLQTLRNAMTYASEAAFKADERSLFSWFTQRYLPLIAFVLQWSRPTQGLAHVAEVYLAFEHSGATNFIEYLRAHKGRYPGLLNRYKANPEWRALIAQHCKLREDYEKSATLLEALALRSTMTTVAESRAHTTFSAISNARLNTEAHAHLISQCGLVITEVELRQLMPLLDSWDELYAGPDLRPFYDAWLKLDDAGLKQELAQLAPASPKRPSDVLYLYTFIFDDERAALIPDGYRVVKVGISSEFWLEPRNLRVANTNGVRFDPSERLTLNLTPVEVRQLESKLKAMGSPVEAALQCGYGGDEVRLVTEAEYQAMRALIETLRKKRV